MDVPNKPELGDVFSTTSFIICRINEYDPTEQKKEINIKRLIVAYKAVYELEVAALMKG